MFERFQGPDSPSPRTQRSRRKRFGLSLGLAALLLVGAAVASIVVNGDHNGRPQTTIPLRGVPSCWLSVDFESRHYLEVGGMLPRRGELLGTGIDPGCYFGRGGDVTVTSSDGTTTLKPDIYKTAAQSVNVYGVIGVDPSDAVMIEHDMSTDPNILSTHDPQNNDTNAIYFSESTLVRLEDAGCRLGAVEYRAALECLKSSESSP
jgi:hypothetical protein